MWLSSHSHRPILLISISILVGHCWNSYKWNYTVCTLLYLDSFMKYNILNCIHVCSYWTTIHSFLLLNNIPLYDYNGEGNVNPLQCSCLENPRDGGTWWAAVCGVTQSRTRLKWLSSSSSSIWLWYCLSLLLWMDIWIVLNSGHLQIKQWWTFFFFFICSEFCHTLKWNSHGFTCVPHPDPSTNLPLHSLPLGLPSAPGPSACLMYPTWAGDLFHPR